MNAALRRWFCPALLGGGLLLGLGGCAGYHLGSVAKLSYSTVAVPMFTNKTVLPQMEAQITNGIIRRLQEDGSVKIANRDDADVVVIGVITKYHRTVLRTDKTDTKNLSNQIQVGTGVPREYRVEITATVELLDLHKQQPVVPKTELTGSADVFIGDDLQSADYQALPLAAEDLARKVAVLVTDRWE